MTARCLSCAAEKRRRLIGVVVGAKASLVRATQHSTAFTGKFEPDPRDCCRGLAAAAPHCPLFDYHQAYGTTSQPLNPTIKTKIVHADAKRDEYLKKEL